MPDGVAYEVTQILQNNVTGGTGTGAYYGDPAAAGKTGTTDNSADAWFAGYTPKASTVVWVGYPNAQISMTSVHGITVTGGSFPASIWQLFMSRALRHMPEVGWPQPKHPAVWLPFQGEFAFVGAPAEPKKDKDEDEGEGPPPTTTAPPPTTTEPPPTTTEGR
jgi:penicillin-binding protein 1A